MLNVIGIVTPCLIAVFAQIALAQDYPNRPVRIVVPFAAGNSSDVVARVIAAHLTTALGQQVIVDNRPGAGATIGTEYAAKQPPDGYTLVLGSPGGFIINPIMQKLKYNPLTDFAAVSALVWVPMVMVVRADSPIKDVKALVALEKEKTRGIYFGSGGSGGTQQLIMESFASAAQIALTHVPYKGGTAAITDLAGGQISVVADAVSVVLPFIQSGKVRAIGVTLNTRLPQLPDVPTIDEQGFRFNVTSWMVMAAPAGTPAAILDKLDTEIKKVLSRPDARKTLFDQGFTEVNISREKVGDFIRSEMSDWRKVITASGATID